MITSRRRKCSPEEGPFSSSAPTTPGHEDEEEEDEEPGNTPVKSKAPLATSATKDSWKERIVHQSPFTAHSASTSSVTVLDLSTSPPSSSAPSPSSPKISRRSSQLKMKSSNPASRLSSTVVLTVQRCAAWKKYVGHRISIPLPQVAAIADEKPRKSSRKKSNDSVVVSIGALEECDHVFENDQYLSGRSPLPILTASSSS